MVHRVTVGFLYDSFMRFHDWGDRALSIRKGSAASPAMIAQTRRHCALEGF